MVHPVDTVKFFPIVVNMPQVTLEDRLKQASSDIVRILTNPSREMGKKCNSSEVYQALLELGKIVGTAEKIPTIKEVGKQIYPEKQPPIQVLRVENK